MVNQSIRRQVTKRSDSPSARGGWGQGGPSIVELAIRLLVPSRRAGWGPYSAPTFSMHAQSPSCAQLATDLVSLYRSTTVAARLSSTDISIHPSRGPTTKL